jgi:hypothetical protein
MYGRDKLINLHLEALAVLGWQPAPVGDAIDQLAGFELLRGDGAAFVAGRDTSTVARWAAAAAAEAERRERKIIASLMGAAT